VQLVRHHFQEAERQARVRLRLALEARYPETAARLKAHYGLHRFASAGDDATGTAAPVVVLVHGLDDPGRVWRNLAPTLAAEGYAVWILTYPNDQPVASSARFFRAQLLAGGPPRSGPVSVVAHSMGGLVTRELLTDPALDYGRMAAAGKLPVITQLVMVGTPNHGSELARFRGFTELRDQWDNLAKEDYHWMAGIVDGAGEAGIDLTPGSRFLAELNARPHPPGIDLLVIAGIMGPAQTQAIRARADQLAAGLPEAVRGAADQLAEGLVAMTEKVGDGLVAVQSARLDGVPLVTVQGTHLTMIRNMTVDSARVPPAIPVILRQLQGVPPEG
jgi:pimeloyl-ACP methyl ester carboxylesterase